MRTCIICLASKPAKKFNKEHVFPETIGGSYTINNVCLTCNGNMGKRIDTPFVSQAHIATFRKAYNLQRGNRRISNPFKTFNQNPDNDFIVKWKNNQLTTASKGKPLAIVEEERDGKRYKKAVISQDPDEMTPEWIAKIKRKVAKHLNASEEEIVYTTQETEIPEKQITLYGANNVVIFEAIKIAYEFTATNLEDYLVDPVASYYRSMLRSGNINRIFLRNHYLDLKQNYLSIDQQYIDAVIQNHVVFLYYVDGIGLIATVKFFTSPPFFYSSFLMSASEKYQTLPPIGLINDFRTKQIYFL